MHAHLTAAIVSNDPLFLQKVLANTVNGTTYAGIRARCTGIYQSPRLLYILFPVPTPSTPLHNPFPSKFFPFQTPLLPYRFQFPASTFPFPTPSLSLLQPCPFLPLPHPLSCLFLPSIAAQCISPALLVDLLEWTIQQHGRGEVASTDASDTQKQAESETTSLRLCIPFPTSSLPLPYPFINPSLRFPFPTPSDRLSIKATCTDQAGLLNPM